jgi:hypothetical protein
VLVFSCSGLANFDHGSNKRVRPFRFVSVVQRFLTRFEPLYADPKAREQCGMATFALAETARLRRSRPDLPETAVSSAEATKEVLFVTARQ